MKRKTYTIELVISSIIFVIVVGLYIWMQSSIGSSVSDVLSIQEKKAEIDTDVALSKTANDLYKETAPDRAILHDTFLSKKNVVDLIEAIEHIVDKTGGTISIGYIDTADDVVTMNVLAQGSWSSVYKILKMAESLPYITTIDKLTVDTSVLGNKLEKRTWNMSFTLRAAITI